MNLARYVVMIVGVDSTVIAAADSSAQELGVAGIRAARSVLGDRLGATEKLATETWDNAIEALSSGAEYPLGSHDSPETAQEAVGAAETASEGVLGVEVQINAAEPQKPGELPEPADDPGAIEFDARLYSVHTDKETGEQVAEPGDGVETREAILLEDLIEGIGSRASFRWEAIAYAMTALAFAQGNPNLALSMVRSYARHSEPETWGESAAILELSFKDTNG